MTIRNSNIISFESQQSKAKGRLLRNENVVIEECWSLIAGKMGELLPLFFSKLDDDLFKVSEKAETNTIGAMFFEVMRQIRKERANIQTEFMDALSKRYDEYWIPQIKQESSEITQEGNKAKEGEFLLMDDSVLEESLAVYGLIEKGNNLYQTDLLHLNQRFCALSGNEKEILELPFSPETLCKEFEKVLQRLSIEVKAKIFIYKIFDRQIISSLGQIYNELNSLLAAKGILPSIPTRSIKKANTPNSVGSSLTAQELSSQETAEATSYLEAFRNMQSLLDGWREHFGISSHSRISSDALLIDSAEVLGALSTLQLPKGDSEVSPEQVLTPENLKQYVSVQLGKLKGDNKVRAIGRPEEDIIDMVGMVFDFILDDKNISIPIKGLIARLQIPIIKVAIIDKSFFAKKAHPARALLNNLGQAGIGVGAAEADVNNPVIKKVEEIVSRVLQEFDQNLNLFQELLDDLSAFLEKENQRSKVVEERTRQATQSKEKVWLAKKAVASEITLRLQSRDTPASFRSFLYNDWKDVLVLAYLRQDKMDGEWERSLEIMNKLLWTVTPPSTPKERQEIIRSIPPLLKSIKEGLDSISLDPHQIAALLKDLEVCHMTALRTSHSQVSDSHKGAETRLPRSPDNEVKIKDPELAEALTEIRTHLPDVGNIEIEEVTASEVGFLKNSGKAQQQGDFAHGVFLEVVNRLQVGDWLEFEGENEKSWRAKLSWKSPATSLCVFVNRRGVKVLEIKVIDLVGLLREGKAKVIEAESTPIMDRALSFLTHSLKNPFTKSSEPVNS